MLYVFLNITLEDIIISNHCQLNLMFWFQESSCILLIYLFSLNYQDWDKFLWSMHVMSTHYQFFLFFLTQQFDDISKPSFSWITSTLSRLKVPKLTHVCVVYMYYVCSKM